jgi:hypothetical protein
MKNQSEIQKHLTAMRRSMSAIEALLSDSPQSEVTAGDPRLRIPGQVHLSPFGIESVYQCYDNGMSPHQVAGALGITDRAAGLRHVTWTRAGGINRSKQVA